MLDARISPIWYAAIVVAGIACVSPNPAFEGSGETASSTELGDGDPGDGDPGESGDASGDGDGDPGDGDPGDGDPGDGDGDPNSCPPEQTSCDGQCIDLSTSAKHCGECNNPCAELQQCFDGACVALDRIVFATSVGYTGGLGGLDGADMLCTGHAKEVNIEGEFRAWLSTDLVGPAQRMTKSDGPYVLPTGQLVATDWADLTDGTLLHPINIDEFGDPIGEGPIVCAGYEIWTNTNPDGTPRGNEDCSDWGLGNLSNGLGSTGYASQSDANWTRGPCTAVICGSSLPLYCVQQ